MRVAVIGGTGLIGRHTSRALEHAAVVVARSTGADVTTGASLDAALARVQAVIDVTNTPAQRTAGLTATQLANLVRDGPSVVRFSLWQP